MLRNALSRAGLASLAVLAACSGGRPSPAGPPQPASTPEATAAAPTPTSTPAAGNEEASTLDGVYTAEQAARGRELYESICSECHETSDWQELAFQNRWAGQSTYQLWYYINDRMPYDNPWSLSRQQVTDVLTFILQLNDLPAGSVEMGTDDDSIDDYWIVWSDRR